MCAFWLRFIGSQAARRAMSGMATLTQDHSMAQIRDLVRMDRAGRVAHIRIDDPPLNTISAEIAQELAHLVAKCGSDDAVRAILLDSAGDKPPFAADGAALLSELSWESQFAMLRKGQRAMTAIEFSSKPVVMAIH